MPPSKVLKLMRFSPFECVSKGVRSGLAVLSMFRRVSVALRKWIKFEYTYTTRLVGENTTKPWIGSIDYVYRSNVILYELVHRLVSISRGIVLMQMGALFSSRFKCSWILKRSTYEVVKIHSPSDIACVTQSIVVIIFNSEREREIVISWSKA